MTDDEQKVASYEDLCANFKIDVPEYYNFGFDVIDAWAKKDRNKLAMIWTDQKGNEKKYTFFDLMRLSNQAVNICIKYGIKKGDRVMLMLPRAPEWWIFTIALIKIGAVYCPATTMLTAKDLKYRIQAADIKMIITMAEYAERVEEIREECPTLAVRLMIDGTRDGWVSYPVELDYPAPCSHKLVNLPGMRRTRSSDPLLIFFTSGTTGEPKMVVHDHAYPLGHLVTGQVWHDLHPNDLHLTISDTGWGKSAWGKLYGQWIIGACIFVYDIRSRFHATEILPLLERYGITTFCCPPTIYRMLILADLDKFDLADMRHCCSAGEPLNPEVIRAWQEGTGRTIYEGYGQTETVLCIGTFPGMKCKPGSMGRPAPGWHIELHDDDGNPVGVGEEGRIAIKLDPRPVGLFRGYLNNEEENCKVFQNGFYYTGDKACMDEDGYFWFIGRDDDVIKSSGYRIGPFEVESALMEHPAVQEAAVIGSPDVIRGLVVKAFITLKPGYNPSESLIKDIQKHVKRVTAPYKYPRAIEFVESLPKTISGKIKRYELREREMKQFMDNNSHGVHSGSKCAE
ncbi:MAG TPA: AMP-binding protein [Methanoculleus sp.]|mgnify:FL=1|jgi:acetyl-CoA synthetase|uniref:AMP-binding protein n=1 Tax=Methanoculleus sp. TaxID=90427 RepID=UPI001B7CAC5B|nr:AMP-binding protein [Methanoculleus sp.]MBP7144000.1 AMP-binding protein [Methanoculleus sp.]HNT06891.1 AMP-binding protein [Methanoculleus sp.]HOC83584.1 AMP-binding protein [Methanoculleus sp.]HOS66892.1 AMP-binding protein [Methanoculleus sp.]HPK80963.1 AMP-binding protein [Methanoculleus sp.]